MTNNHRIPKLQTTRNKYLRIQERYKQLYDVKRIRHDDVISRLKDEFFIEQENTIYRILGTSIPEPSVEDPRVQKLPFD